jgi:LuxR family transcriptional regulator, maltose regulon positive regulatory protein
MVTSKKTLRHALKDDKEASVHLSEVQKICETIQLHQAEFMALLVEAQMAFDRGDDASGRDLLRKGLAIGREYGYANAFFWVDSTIAGLCAKALEAGIETEYVQGLIRRRSLVPDVPLLHLENWPWQLRIYTLGQFEMVRDGEVVKFSGKVQQKPLLLLKALIAFGGRDVREEQLCDVLWPDAEGDLAHRSFETTLYRLRRLLGKDKAILLSKGRLTLNMQYCWVDAFALDRIIDEAEALWEAGQPPQDTSAKAIQLTQRAITMYKGHFLDVEAEQPWMFSLRERLRVKYVRGVQSLGSYWETAVEFERAITCYEKAIEVDDLAEDVYRRLMICHERLGRPAQALAVYRRCRSALNAGLGIEPSAKTRSLAETLHSANM